MISLQWESGVVVSKHGIKKEDGQSLYELGAHGINKKRGQSLYELGFKFCSACGKFFKILARKCPLCNRFLRYMPKGKSKTRYNERNRIYDRIGNDKTILQNT